jgi:chemotaxis protein methyltransferase CheR
MAPEPEIAAADVTRLLSAICDRYGYDFRDYAPASMERRVRTALRRTGAASVSELQRASLADKGAFAQLLDSLTVDVSELFRDPGFYRALRTHLVPLLRTYPRLNLWSCGCAGGEESASLAIVLDEEGLYDRCQIYATDLNPRAVERARQGVYPASALATLVERYHAAGGAGDPARYYTSAYGHIVLRESLRRNVVFFQHDLVGDHVFGALDVVVCRNVLIYFGRDLQRRVMRKLADSLRPGGFLCLGPSERLTAGSESRAWFADFSPAHHIYRHDRSQERTP